MRTQPIRHGIGLPEQSVGGDSFHVASSELSGATSAAATINNKVARIFFVVYTHYVCVVLYNGRDTRITNTLLLLFIIVRVAPHKVPIIWWSRPRGFVAFVTRIGVFRAAPLASPKAHFSCNPTHEMCVGNCVVDNA